MIALPRETDYRGRLLALVASLTPDEGAAVFEDVRQVIGQHLARLARIPAPDDPTAALTTAKPRRSRP